MQVPHLGSARKGDRKTGGRQRTRTRMSAILYNSCSRIITPSLRIFLLYSSVYEDLSTVACRDLTLKYTPHCQLYLMFMTSLLTKA